MRSSALFAASERGSKRTRKTRRRGDAAAASGLAAREHRGPPRARGGRTRLGEGEMGRGIGGEKERPGGMGDSHEREQEQEQERQVGRSGG